jgi:hypothetical protein
LDGLNFGKEKMTDDPDIWNKIKPITTDDPSVTPELALRIKKRDELILRMANDHGQELLSFYEAQFERELYRRTEETFCQGAKKMRKLCEEKVRSFALETKKIPLEVAAELMQAIASIPVMDNHGE